MNWKLWLTIIGAVIAALFGVRTVYEKRLDKERDRAIQAHQKALAEGDNAGAAAAAADVARLERDLAEQRAAPINDRVAAAVSEARRRGAGRAAG